MGIYEINNQIGSLMGYWINYIANHYIPADQSRQWQVPLALQFVPASLLLVIAIFVLPESPRFLVKKGNKPKAVKVLAFIRHLPHEHPEVLEEIRNVEDAVRIQEAMKQTASRFGLAKELTWKGNRNRVMIGLALMLGQNLTGINAVNFYTPTIFRSIGFDGTEVVLLASGMLSLPQ